MNTSISKNKVNYICIFTDTFKNVIILLLIFFLSSCTATEIISTIKDLRVAFTNTDNKAIDSMKVTSAPLTFSIYNNDIERVKELKKDGYFIKYDYNEKLITITVQRKDSVLYFYKK